MQVSWSSCITKTAPFKCVHSSPEIIRLGSNIICPISTFAQECGGVTERALHRQRLPNCSILAECTWFNVATLKAIGNACRREKGHVLLSKDAKIAEIFRRPFFYSQPFQSGAPSLLAEQFAVEWKFRSVRVSSVGRGQHHRPCRALYPELGAATPPTCPSHQTQPRSQKRCRSR